MSSLALTPTLISSATSDLDKLFHELPPPYHGRLWTTRILLWVERSIEQSALAGEEREHPPTSDGKKKTLFDLAPGFVRDTLAYTAETAEEGEGSDSASSAPTPTKKGKEPDYVYCRVFVQPIARAHLMWQDLVGRGLSQRDIYPPAKASVRPKLFQIFSHPYPNSSGYSLEDPKTGGVYEHKVKARFTGDKGTPLKECIFTMAGSETVLRQPLIVPVSSPHTLKIVATGPFSKDPEEFHIFQFDYKRYNWRFETRFHLMRSDSDDRHASAKALFVRGHFAPDSSLDDVYNQGVPYICLHARRYMTREQRESLHRLPLHEDIPLFLKCPPEYLEIVAVEIAVKYDSFQERLLGRVCSTLRRTFFESYQLCQTNPVLTPAATVPTPAPPPPAST